MHYLDELTNETCTMFELPYKTVHLGNNIFDLAIFISYCGNVDMIKRLINDFNKYLIDDRFPTENIFLNCIIYAIYAGNLDIIKFISLVNTSKSFIWKYKKDVLSIAFYNNKIDICEVLRENDVSTVTYYGPLCI